MKTTSFVRRVLGVRVVLGVFALAATANADVIYETSDPFGDATPAVPPGGDAPADPFGGDATADPFGGDTPSDPFGGDTPSDPFGDDKADENNPAPAADPFADPFGN